MWNALSMHKPAPGASPTPGSQKEPRKVSHPAGKQQPKALLTHCSVPASLCDSCVTGGLLLTVSGMFNKPEVFSL